MKSEKLMDYIGQIDDSMIAEADASIVKAKPVIRPWIKWASVAVAAAACLLIAVPFILDQKQPTDHTDHSGLPKLAVNNDLDGQASGFEGHLAFNIDELRDNNPWTENNNLTTLPVFNNPMKYDIAGMPINGLSTDEMLAKAEEIVNIFGLEITSLYTTPSQDQIEQIMQKLQGEDEETIRMNTAVYRATAECKGANIDVEKNGSLMLTLTAESADLVNDIDKLNVYDNFTISFDYGYELIDDTQYYVGLPLSDGYSFTYDNTSYEQAMEITKYLFSKYGAFTGIKEPGYNLFAEYTYNGNLTRLHTAVFENAGSLTDRILSFNFNNLYFNASDMGGLGGIRYVKTDLSQIIGDYPIITAEEARTLLLEKHYITTVPEELPDEEYIANVELIYRTSNRDTVFMPYYKFFVEMPTMQRENGLKTYGVFYVPAVKGEFLENIPLWDGSFN